MKNYETYAAENFVTDTWFLAWVKHGQPEAQQFWEQWQQQHPDRREVILLAKDMAEALNNRPRNLADEQVQREIDQIIQLTWHSLPKPSRNSFKRVIGKASLWMTAAAFMALFIGGWVLWSVLSPHSQQIIPAVAEQSKRTNPAGWVDQVNGTSQPVQITLPDGSRMTLLPQSRASYPPVFNSTKREVHLTGEATFAVVHDSSRPFLVMSGSLITRVLGTRFRVRAVPGDARITVSVQRGKVSVYDRRDLAVSQRRAIPNVPGVILTANQQVVYDAQRTVYQRELVTKPTLIDPTEAPERFEFQDTPVPVVFDRLQKSYGITMVYDTALFRDCTLTASLAGVPLHDQLKLICASVGATYEIVDTHIVVTGKGCH